MAFSVDLPIRFGDCDVAGIAYYPRLLALVDAAIEDWTMDAIGVDRATMHKRHRLGLPTLTLTTHFERPCRLGETITFTVTVATLGDSSITLDVAAQHAGDRRFSARLVQVLMDIESAQKVSWPDGWRSRVELAMAAMAGD